MNKYKVVFHVDEMDKWELLLGNVTNLLNELEAKDLSVIVLGNSTAVKYYVNNQQQEDLNKMKELSKQGVKFIACNNALKGYKIEPKNLYPFVNIVPAGVAELVLRQREGYA